MRKNLCRAFANLITKCKIIYYTYGNQKWDYLWGMVTKSGFIYEKTKFKDRATVALRWIVRPAFARRKGNKRVMKKIKW